MDGLTAQEEEEEREEEGGRREYEQAMSAIATAVNSLKSQSVSMANRHRKRWRKLAQQRSNGNSPESSSSRESVEGRKGGTTEGDVGGTEESREHASQGDHSGGCVAGSEIAAERTVDAMKDQGLLELLDQYSQQLVELVRERTLQLPVN